MSVGLFIVTHEYEVGIVSNRKSECCGELSITNLVLTARQARKAFDTWNSKNIKIEILYKIYLNFLYIFFFLNLLLWLLGNCG